MSKFLAGAELWPLPGFSAMGALATPLGIAPIALSGPRDASEVVVLAGESQPVVRGLAAHAARKGLGVIALAGVPGEAAATLLGAALELAAHRGALRMGLLAHGGWTSGALEAAVGEVEALAVLDPSELGASIDPQRLAGIPLWIASGTEAAPAARALHARGRHPRSLIELPAVPKLEHAVNDVAAEIVPFLRHALRTR